MAAGITLRKDALGEFRAFRDGALADAVATARRDEALLIDGALTAGAVNGALSATLARAGPFGAGNPEPVIALPAHTLTYVEEVAQTHVRARLQSGDGSALNAIAFRAAGHMLGAALRDNRGRLIHAAGCLAIDRWQGEERVQLRLIDIAPAEPLSAVRPMGRS